MSLLLNVVRVVQEEVVLQVAEIRGKDPRLLELELGLLCLPLSLLTDLFLAQFLLSPLVTMCWRSGWLLADWVFDRLLPGNKTMGFVISLALGTFLTIIFRFVNFVPSTLLSSISFAAQFAFSRAFTVMYFCAYMMMWRGWWNILALLAPPSSLLLTTALTLQFLTSSLPSNLGPPLAFSHDTKKHYLSLPVFNQCSSPVVSLLTTSVLELLVILAWFSTWTTLDWAGEMLTSSKMDNILLSLSLSLVPGLLAASLQFPLLYYLRSGQQGRNEGSFCCQHFVTKIIHDFLCILGLTSTVASLRGYWMFLDLVVPDVFWLSLAVPGLIGLSCLVSLRVVSSLHGGVVVRPGQQRGTLVQSGLLTYWLVRETEHQEGQCDGATRENHTLLDDVALY